MNNNKENRNPIRNVEDLLNEIDRVELLRDQQEEYLKSQFGLIQAKVQAPIRFANMLFDRVPGVGMMKGVVAAVRKNTESEKADWITKGLRLATPILLNRTLLKNSGWLKRLLVTAASESAVSKVNKSNISNVVSSIANFIRPKGKKKKVKKGAQEAGEITAEEAVEGNKYGIPNYSETF